MPPSTPSTQASLYQASLKHLLGPIQHLVEDESISEVMINGHSEVYIERQGRIERSADSFPSARALEAAMRNLAQFVGKRLTPESQSIEARLPDGSRVHIVQAPASGKGMAVTIRKFSRQTLTLNGLVEKGTLSPAAAELLDFAVVLAKTLLVSGGTGSGKTTLLNCLSGSIPAGERILVLEDSTELQLQQPHVVPLEVQAPDRYGRGGINIRELFRASLRMRPDRIIVGECRGGEALDMIQAMTSGHSGSMSTLHANTPRDALNRLETMALMSGVEIPLSALRAQISSAVDLIVQIARLHDGSRRITRISEVLGMGEDGRIKLTDLFVLEFEDDGTPRLKATGQSPSFSEELRIHPELRDKIRESGPLWRI